MSEFLLYYKRPDPTTWVYMSSFLTIGLYFVFHRFWSVRNLDIILLILLAPGLLMVHEGRRRQLWEIEKVATQSRDAEEEPTLPNSDSAANDSSKQTTDISDIPESTTLIAFQGESAKGDEATREESQDSGEPSQSESQSQVTDEAAPNPIREPSSDPPKPDPVPSITEDSKAPLIAEPDALDELLEATSNQSNVDESEASYTARQLQRSGFILLFVVEFLILIRLMIDPVMIRRPLLDPNLTTGGLYFISISLFVFMMGNVVTSTPRMSVWQGPELGPGYALMYKLPSISTRPVSNAVGGESPATEDEMELEQQGRTLLARILAILAHLAIVSGVILIGDRHFGNLRAGVGCATLYLIMPYTAQMTGRVDHALPAALLLWAVLNYRKPIVAGVFLGLAAGLVYYPLFLLPLWCSFYWQRGVRRFAVGVSATLVVLVLVLSFGGVESLADHARRMFGLLEPMKDPRGIWGLGWEPVYRFPVIVAFVILSFFFASWPSSKNLGTLISGSAVLMVATQFWHGHFGGLYIAWFLPLLLLTIFRPNLQDRIATKVVLGRNRRSTSEATAA